jgi:hypothetical protein
MPESGMTRGTKGSEPGGLSRAIAEHLAAEVRRRRAWDEVPCLYTLYVEGGQPRLGVIPLPDGIWAAAPSAQVLLALADLGPGEMAMLQAAAPAGLYGLAFRTEAWMVYAPEGDDAAVRKMIEDGNARRVSQRPDRIEVRQIWAVDRTRTTYMASQERGSSDVQTDVRRPEPGMDHVGANFAALDRLVSAFLGVTLPGRSLKWLSRES